MDLDGDPAPGSAARARRFTQRRSESDRSRRRLPAKVRAFGVRGFLVEQFERNDYERRWTA
jgi:hypothetical protein